jgi:hypothetical protein
MKKCCFCNLFKPLEDFYNNKNVKSGKASFCKQCGKEKRDNYYKRIIIKNTYVKLLMPQN